MELGSLCEADPPLAVGGSRRTSKHPQDNGEVSNTPGEYDLSNIEPFNIYIHESERILYVCAMTQLSFHVLGENVKACQTGNPSHSTVLVFCCHIFAVLAKGELSEVHIILRVIGILSSRRWSQWSCKMLPTRLVIRVQTIERPCFWSFLFRHSRKAVLVGVSPSAG